jgi:hypothetical protein
MDLPEPIIFHDHICGVFPRLRSLLDEAQAGRISAYDAVFATPDGGVNKSMTLSFMLLAEYRQYGQQSFVIGPTLQEMFDRTSLEGVPQTRLKMPFPCIYLALPGCPWQIWGGVTGWHDVSGVVVRYHEETNSFTLFLWAAENENARVAGDDASFWLNLDMNEADRLGLDVETYLLTVMGDRHRESSDTHPDTRIEDEQRALVYNKIEDTALSIIRVAFNLLIYLQSNSPEQTADPGAAGRKRRRKQIKKQIDRIKNPRKRKTKIKALRRELARLSDAHITWIGKSIEESAGTTHERKPGQKRVRHWVRGHWWPRLSNTEAIARWGIRWKQPFERNKDCEEAEPSRHYRFRDDTDEAPKPEAPK